MVSPHDQLVASQSEILRFLQAVDDTQGFSFGRGVATLSGRGEARSNSAHTPSSGTACGFDLGACAVFLEEDVPEAGFAPVCEKARRFCPVKCLDALFDLTGDDLLCVTEQLIKGLVPVPWAVLLQQCPKRKEFGLGRIEDGHLVDQGHEGPQVGH